MVLKSTGWRQPCLELPPGRLSSSRGSRLRLCDCDVIVGVVRELHAGHHVGELIVKGRNTMRGFCYSPPLVIMLCRDQFFKENPFSVSSETADSDMLNFTERS